MATIPNPITWLNGQQVTAAQLNTDVRDGVTFYAATPFCALRKSADQTLTNGSAADVTWDIEDADSDGSHSNVTNNNRFTAQTAGWYYFNATIAFGPPLYPTGMREATIVKNGNNAFRQSRSDDFPEWEDPSNAAHDASIVNCRGFVSLNVGDYIAVQVFQDSGNNVAISGANTRLTVRWMRQV